MTPHSYTNKSVRPPSINKVNEVKLYINPNNINTSCTQLNNDPHTTKANDNPRPKFKSSVFMPSDIQVHRQVPLNNAKISEQFKSIVTESDNDIGHTDLIEMHIATIKPQWPPNLTHWPSNITAS